MPAPAAESRPRRMSKALAGLAGLACVACCALPTLITAGIIGAGASAIVGWLPAIVALAVLAAGTWWLGQRRRSCSCSPKTADEDECSCVEPVTSRSPARTADKL